MLDLVLSFRSSIPGGGWSVRCVCFKVTFLCGLVNFTTSPTGWVDRSRFSVFLIICIACVSIVGSFIVGVRVRLTTVIVVIVGTICVFSGVFFFSFELAALFPIVTWIWNSDRLVWASPSFAV